MDASFALFLFLAALAGYVIWRLRKADPSPKSFDKDDASWPGV